MITVGWNKSTCVVPFRGLGWVALRLNDCAGGGEGGGERESKHILFGLCFFPCLSGECVGLLECAAGSSRVGGTNFSLSLFHVLHVENATALQVPPEYSSPRHVYILILWNFVRKFRKRERERKE